MTGTYGPEGKHLRRVLLRQLFSKVIINYLIVFFTQCTLFFQYVCFYCLV